MREVPGHRLFELKEVEAVVQVPPGIENGAQITFKGQGHPGRNGGVNGHTVVIVSVKKHPLFDRQGCNLTCTVPVTYPQLVLGTEIELPNLEGTKIKFKMPPHTQAGTKFRIKKQGLPSTVGPDPKKDFFGDLLIEVKLDVPTTLSDNHRIILEQLAELDESHAYPAVKAFRDKIDSSE